MPKKKKKGSFKDFTFFLITDIIHQVLSSFVLENMQFTPELFLFCFIFASAML